MTPSFQIFMDGLNISDNVNSRLLLLTVTDEAGMKSDAFELKLDNGPTRLPLPKKGAKVRIWLGYRETGLQYMGTYTVDERELGGEPAEYMTIRGKAADMTEKGGGKKKESKSYDDKTIEDIVSDVAKRCGLSASVDGSLGSKKIKHIDQTNEGNFHFLSRLAEQHGAVFKPVEGQAVFAPRDKVKSMTGRSTTSVNITLGEGVKTWRAVLQERGKYDEVKARWHDFREAQTKEESSGGGGGGGKGPSRTLTKRFNSKDEAKAAAEAEADRLQRGTGTVTIEMVGNPFLSAEGRATLSGFAEADGPWKVKSVKHTIGPQGYDSSVELETPKDKKDSTS